MDTARAAREICKPSSAAAGQGGRRSSGGGRRLRRSLERAEDLHGEICSRATRCRSCAVCGRINRRRLSRPCDAGEGVRWTESGWTKQGGPAIVAPYGPSQLVVTRLRARNPPDASSSAQSCGGEARSRADGAWAGGSSLRTGELDCPLLDLLTNNVSGQCRRGWRAQATSSSSARSWKVLFLTRLSRCDSPSSNTATGLRHACPPLPAGSPGRATPSTLPAHLDPLVLELSRR